MKSEEHHCIFRDGTLIKSSHKVINKKKIKYSKSLDLIDVVICSFNELGFQQEKLAIKVRKLRKQLILCESLLKIRTKERDSVKKAHKRKLQQIDDLKEINDELKSNLIAAHEDYNFLKKSIIEKDSVNKAISPSIIDNSQNSDIIPSIVTKVKKGSRAVAARPKHT